MEWIIGGLILLWLISAFGDSDKDEKKEIADIKEKQKAAEEYILKSGDEEAIKQLMLMRASPQSYDQQFKKYSAGNDIMRTAFGVFSGMIAANLVMDAMYAHQLEEALANFDMELAKMGGLENFDVGSADSYFSDSNDDMYSEDSDSEGFF